MIAGGNIIIRAADYDPDDTIINVLAITEIVGTGYAAGATDQHHIDVLTNGWIALTEYTDDLRVGEIRSTANDVLLYAPARTIDALNDAGTTVTADVTGVNITMSAGAGFVNPDPENVAGEVADPTILDEDQPLGGIGTPDNFLEINVDVLNGSGVLRAFDITADTTAGIFLTETTGDMKVHTVHTFDSDSADGHVSLATQGASGSIMDAKDDPDADVIGNTIDLYASLGSIGEADNDLDIDSQAYAGGTVGLRASDSIYLTETESTPSEDMSDEDYGLRLVLALTLTGDIRLTVRETSDLDEDLILLEDGFVLFLENVTENVGDSGDYEIESAGWVELRIGDDLVDAQSPNTVIIAGEQIDIYLDDLNNGDDNSDTGYGAYTTFMGTLTPGSGYVTSIYGYTDVDYITFDQTTLGGYTRVYGSNLKTPAGATAPLGDGEDLFTVDRLQTMTVGTLTLDGQAGSDHYIVNTNGSQNEDRNYIVNVLDTGASDDGVDVLSIYGVDSNKNGSDPENNDLPYATDDIFLLRGLTAIAGLNGNETANRPAFVALLHGTVEQAQAGSSTAVERINYDAAINGRLEVYGRGGNDGFATDDNSATPRWTAAPATTASRSASSTARGAIRSPTWTRTTSLPPWRPRAAGCPTASARRWWPRAGTGTTSSSSTRTRPCCVWKAMTATTCSSFAPSRSPIPRAAAKERPRPTWTAA